jgi:hypothetical protein
LAVVSPARRSFFHIVRVQLKISLEEMLHICRRLGEIRPLLWLSPAWELLASRAAAVVRQYGHFRCPDAFRFSQQSPAGAWMLAAHFRPPDSSKQFC